MSEHLTQSLLALLGVEGLVALAEQFGGRRLYIPQSIPEDHPIAKAVGVAGAEKLVDRYARGFLRVPLARDLRARHYRSRGLSNGEIASKLSMTETGVDKMFARMHAPPRKGDSQLRLKF